jgi:hypothetical protein
MQYGTEEKRPRRFGQSFLLIMLETWNLLWLILRTLSAPLSFATL